MADKHTLEDLRHDIESHSADWPAGDGSTTSVKVDVITDQGTLPPIATNLETTKKALQLPADLPWNLE